mgnify:CR=1 FL=1
MKAGDVVMRRNPSGGRFLNFLVIIAHSQWSEVNVIYSIGQISCCGPLFLLLLLYFTLYKMIPSQWILLTWQTYPLLSLASWSPSLCMYTPIYPVVSQPSAFWLRVLTKPWCHDLGSPWTENVLVETFQQNLYFGLKVLPWSGRFCPGIGKA